MASEWIFRPEDEAPFLGATKGVMIVPDNNEALRIRYKPVVTDVLFVGESVPAGGTFFYKENSYLYRYTEKAFQNFFVPVHFAQPSFRIRTVGFTIFVKIQ